MIARVLIVLACLAVVGCFFTALVLALPAADAAVVVVADPAVTLSQRWFVRVLGIDPPRRAPFVGTVNGVSVDARGLVELDRALVVDVVGVVGDVPVSLHMDVTVVPAPPTSTQAAAPVRSAPGLLPLGDGPLRATLKTQRPAPGQAVVVDVASRVPFSAELMVGGVTRAMADDTATFTLPDDVDAGALVVVRLSDSPLPTARGKTLVTFVGGDPPVADETTTTPTPAQTPVISPSLGAQQEQRRAAAKAASEQWRLRLRMLDGLVMLVVTWLAVRSARRTPAASIGAVVVVAVLLAALDLVLGFVG